MEEPKGLPAMEPIPVPLPVIVVADEVKKPVPVPTGPHGEAKLPSVTTPEEDRTTASQRRVNLIWETTQSLIALLVTGTSVMVAANLSVRGDGGSAAFLLLSNAFFLVIGFYFSRTNHTKTGGIGNKQEKER